MQVFMPEFMNQNMKVQTYHTIKNNKSYLPQKNHTSKTYHFNRFSPKKQMKHKYRTLSLLSAEKSTNLDSSLTFKKFNKKQFEQNKSQQYEKQKRPIHSRGSQNFRTSMKNRNCRKRVYNTIQNQTIDLLQLVKKNAGLLGKRKIIQCKQINVPDNVKKMKIRENRPNPQKNRFQFFLKKANQPNQCRPWSANKLYFQHQPE